MNRTLSKIICIGLIPFYMAGVAHAQATVVTSQPIAEGLLGQINGALAKATADLTAINKGNAMSFLEQIAKLTDTLSKTTEIVGFLLVGATGGTLEAEFKFGGFKVKPNTGKPSATQLAQLQLDELETLTANLTEGENAEAYSSLIANYSNYYKAKDDYTDTLDSMLEYIVGSTKRLNNMYALLNGANTMGDLTKIQGYVQAEIVSQNNAHLSMQTQLAFANEAVNVTAKKLSASVSCNEFGNAC